MNIQRPENLPPYANLCLQALADSGLGHTISLGGAFGLMHYFEYRATYDVDAWWQTAARQVRTWFKTEFMDALKE
ncbi:MAG: hypothetical protein GY796_23475 [Chloroflexi bacterium]|nr:hypothetical protein [Chloroflexota bacterium]